LVSDANPRFESLPCGGKTGIDAQSTRLLAEAEDGLDAESPQPCGCSCVPGPPAAPDPRRTAIDIRRERVGLHPVALHVRAGASTEDRIEQTEDALGAFAVAEGCVRPAEPGRGVRVLASVLANARRVRANVPRIMQRAVVRRPEQQPEPVRVAHEKLVGCTYRRARGG